MTLTSVCDLLRMTREGNQAKLSWHRVVGYCTIITNRQF